MEHPWVFIEEEMRERGWDIPFLAHRMGGGTSAEVAMDQLALEFYSLQERNLRLGEDSARKLAHAFGVSAEFFINLEAQYLAGSNP